MASGLVSLERDLEQIIEKEENLFNRHATHSVQEDEPNHKRARRLSASHYIPPLANPGRIVSGHEHSSSTPSMSSVCGPKEFLEHIEARHNAASVKRSEHVALRGRRADECHQARQRLNEAALALDRAEKEMPSQIEETLVREANKELSWLDDICSHVDKMAEKAKTGQHFQLPGIREQFCNSAESLRATRDNHRAALEDVSKEVLRKRETYDKCVQERDLCKKHFEQANSAVTQAKEETIALEESLQQMAVQAKQAHDAVQLQELIRQLAAELDRAAALTHEAMKQFDHISCKLQDYNSWVQDLNSFFEGKAVRDTNAIVQGMQAVMPPGDVLVGILSHLLNDSSRQNADMESSSVTGLRNLINKQLCQAMKNMHEQLQAKQTNLKDCERRQSDVMQKLHQEEEQLHCMMVRLSVQAIPTPARKKEAPHLAVTLLERQS